MSRLGGGVTRGVTGVAVECAYDDENAATVARYRFVVENLRRVEAGEAFAERTGTVREVEPADYPMLMSTHDYDIALGFRARRVRASEVV